MAFEVPSCRLCDNLEILPAIRRSRREHATMPVLRLMVASMTDVWAVTCDLPFERSCLERRLKRPSTICPFARVCRKHQHHHERLLTIFGIMEIVKSMLRPSI